ncbi:MAG: hypothetical protein SFW35_11605 [Chitinophagales bacterium]|nr:hypothetical protein [Chitinophagales bacterium]
MNAAKRKQNENEFEHWEELPEGGRKYWFDTKGKTGGFARYIKTVNREELTISFVQEIYNASNELVEIHEKYPVDKGHIKLNQ